jgi:diaminopimelate decarboxylase
MIDRANQIQTPVYRYNLDVLNETLLRAKREADQYDYHLHYAIKANADPMVLKEIVQHGIGADCVSGYEIKAALDAGFQSHQIAFAGVGKTDEEINYGLAQDIFSFNVESIPELEVINELAAELNVEARVAIRVNPDVNAHTHAYITTGLEENKFGINAWEFEELIRILPELSHIRLEGLHVHIGSQITRMDSFKSMCIRVNEIVSWFSERGILFNHLNLGGGLGINYDKPEECPDFKEFFRTIHQFLDKQEQEVHFELGRSLVGQMGDLLTKVLYIKKGLRKHFAIVDAGMTELIRPALYQAFHRIESERELDNTVKYDVVGPICESSDCFGKEISLPELKRGDLLKIRSVGAYGQVMSSQYNLRPLAKIIYIKNNSEFKS